MTNFEKYKEQIRGVMRYGVFKLNEYGEIIECGDKIEDCANCQFHDHITDCATMVANWGMKEVINVINYLNTDDILFLRMLGKGAIYFDSNNKQYYYPDGKRSDGEIRYFIPPNWNLFSNLILNSSPFEFDVNEVINEYDVLDSERNM